MALGMNETELRKYFDSEATATHDKCDRSEYPRIMTALIEHEIPENQAKVLALNQIDLTSICQAVLKTILANNARIESQLKAKGISV